MKTIFIDIDGTLLSHPQGLHQTLVSGPQHVLPGAIPKLEEWKCKGYHIVLTTARTESMRAFTERQLEHLGIFYDQILFGITHGQRYLINDTKPSISSMLQTAEGITVRRNGGLERVELDKKYLIGIVSGYFNPLHNGHLEYIHAAKAQSDCLLVILNNDLQVELKGSQKCLPESVRIQIMKSLRDVDGVEKAIDSDLTVAKTLNLIGRIVVDGRPAAFFNAGDRQTPNEAEHAACVAHGIEEVFLNLPKINSSSSILKAVT